MKDYIIIKANEYGVAYLYRYDTRQEAISQLSRDMLDVLYTTNRQMELVDMMRDLLMKHHVVMPEKSMNQETISDMITFSYVSKLWETIRDNNLLEELMKELAAMITSSKNQYTNESTTTYRYIGPFDNFTEWTISPSIF